LQYPQTDRRNGENLMSPPVPADVWDSTRTMPNMSSDFAIGQVAAEETSLPERNPSLIISSPRELSRNL
jgi:hypothetical protein